MIYSFMKHIATHFPLLFSVPGSPSLWVLPGSGSSAVVRWAPPLDCSETGSYGQRVLVEIQGYRLQFGPKNASLNATVEFSHRERNFTAGDLSPGSSYVFVLSARSRAGYGDAARKELTIPMFPPVGNPKIIEFVNATCCSLQLSWLPPASEERNGVITQYTIAYRMAPPPKPSSGPVPSAIPDPSVPPWLITLPASESSYTILGLNHSTAYEVRIRAHNKAGPGPFSPPLVCLTLAFETGRAGLRPERPFSTPKHWFRFTSLVFFWSSPQITKINKVWASSYRSASQQINPERWRNAKLKGTPPPTLLHSLTYTSITSPSPPVETGLLREHCLAQTPW